MPCLLQLTSNSTFGVCFGPASKHQRYRTHYMIVYVQHVTRTADIRILFEGTVLYFGKRLRSPPQYPIPARSPVTIIVVVHNGSSDLPLTYPTTPTSMVCYLQIATRGYSYDASKIVLSLMLWLVRSISTYCLSDISRPFTLLHIALFTPGKRTMKRFHSNESKTTFPLGRERMEHNKYVIKTLIKVV